MGIFNPRDWYWILDNSTTQVFSSKVGNYVTVTDTTYVAWLSSGYQPTQRNDTEGNLLADLNGLIPGYVASTTIGLISYANAKQWRLATSGFTLTLSGQTVTFQTDSQSQVFIAAKSIRMSYPNPPTTIDWQFAIGFQTLSAADFGIAAVKIADFVQATFDALRSVDAAIMAGTITTLAQVDAASWPANHQ